MPLRVDFYLLEQKEPEAVIFALVNKAYQQGWRVGIHLSGQDAAKQLDEALWSQTNSAFIPHQIIKTSRCQSSEEPVMLFNQAPDDINTLDYYINYSGAMINYDNAEGRIADIMLGDDTSKANGRERYSYYKQQTCELHYHTL